MSTTFSRAKQQSSSFPFSFPHLFMTSHSLGMSDGTIFIGNHISIRAYGSGSYSRKAAVAHGSFSAFALRLPMVDTFIRSGLYGISGYSLITDGGHGKITTGARE